jgi:hypothetical protein
MPHPMINKYKCSKIAVERVYQKRKTDAIMQRREIV